MRDRATNRRNALALNPIQQGLKQEGAVNRLIDDGALALNPIQQGLKQGRPAVASHSTIDLSA